MTDDEFAQILSLPHELSGIEFKGPGRLTDGRLRAQIVRAILGMSNRRDGGSVIIGVEDNRGTPNPVGLGHDDLETWTYDNLSDQVASYADPSLSFDFEIKTHQQDQFVVIEVAEFDDIPVLCKRDYSHRGHQVLRSGACYVRTRRKPETTEIPIQAEMRDLLDLATDKMVAVYIARARRNGLLSVSVAAPQANIEELSDPGSGGEQ